MSNAVIWRPLCTPITFISCACSVCKACFVMTFIYISVHPPRLFTSKMTCAWAGIGVVYVFSWLGASVIGWRWPSSKWISCPVNCCAFTKDTCTNPFSPWIPNPIYTVFSGKTDEGGQPGSEHEDKDAPILRICAETRIDSFVSYISFIPLEAAAPRILYSKQHPATPRRLLVYTVPKMASSAANTVYTIIPLARAWRTANSKLNMSPA